MHVCCFVFSRRIKQRRRAEGASTRCGPCVCLVFPILAVVGLVPCRVNSHTALGITAQVQQRSTAEMSITRSGRARVVGHSHPREYSRGVQERSRQRCQSHVLGLCVWFVILILAVVGLVPFSVTPTPLQTVQQSSAQSSQENTVRETHCSVRTGPGAGCARDRSSSCTLGSQH